MANIIEVLQERAEKELDKEVRAYIENFTNHPFYNSIKMINVKNVKLNGSTETFWHFFFPNSTAHKTIFMDQIDKKITQVTIEFMGKVERLDNNE